MVIKSTVSISNNNNNIKPASKYQQQPRFLFSIPILKLYSSMCSGNHLCNLYPVQFVDGWEVQSCNFNFFFAICLQQVFFFLCFCYNYKKNWATIFLTYIFGTFKVFSFAKETAISISLKDIHTLTISYKSFLMGFKTNSSLKYINYHKIY